MTWGYNPNIPGGDGIRMQAEVTGGKPAQPRPLRRRRVILERKEYTAFDAHALLDALSNEYRRPGLPY